MIYDKLYPYQKNIVSGEKHKAGHALFMDMGTGKTITSLALAEASPTTKILVVCLVSKLKDWEDDLINYGLSPVVLNKGTKKNTENLTKVSDAIVVSYESMWRLGVSLLNLINDEWFIIVDESHKIKNTKSKVGKYVTKLGERTKHKCVLTGTPQSQGYIDYYNQLRFTGLITCSEKEFKDRYCVYGIVVFGGRYIQQLTGYKNTHEIESLIRKQCVFFKREDDDLAPTHIDVKIPKHKSYDTFLKDKILKDVWGDSTASLRMGLRQLCSGVLREHQLSDHKQVWLKDFLEGLDERVVVFYNFNRERDGIIEVCKSLKKPYSVYDGSTKDLGAFLSQSDGVAICNYGSASTGINDLVKSRIAVMYSPTEDYILFAQSKKRLDRIGQTRPPLIYYLITENSIEGRIYEALNLGKSFDEKMFIAYLHNDNDMI